MLLLPSEAASPDSQADGPPGGAASVLLALVIAGVAAMFCYAQEIDLDLFPAVHVPKRRPGWREVTSPPVATTSMVTGLQIR